jgi:NTE family protein
MGIVPDVICGCSSGALVGAAYALGELDRFEEWVRSLDRSDVVRLLDVSFSRGGILAGERMFRVFEGRAEGRTVESLPVPFGAVATDLADGEEVWLRSGSLLSVVRASMGMPGLFAPIRFDGHWLLDGALVNPVPVSLCRALGAERVIAVNLCSCLLNRDRFPEPQLATPIEQKSVDEDPHGGEGLRRKPERKAEKDAGKGGLLSFEPWMEPLAELTALIRNGLHRSPRGTEERPAPDRRSLSSEWFPESTSPGFLDVLAAALNIMQVRITRQRLAEEPPDLLLEPNLSELGILEVYRAAEAIEEGRRVAEEAREELLRLR